MINLIRAFTLIKDSIPHCIYFTGGDSWLDTDVYDMITENNLQERIIKLGFISEEDLVMMYNLADCYLYPSLYEGFGLPILEAQACGCPVITSTVSSCPEVAGAGAMYIDPHNVGDMARAMTEVVTDKKLRKKLVDEGLKNCAQFTWDKTATALLEILNNSPLRI
jgi:glycosyltransferase involved in cell wall biosynthesis